MLTILDDKNKGFALSATDFLTKPLDRERLRSVIAPCGGQKAERRALVVEDDPDTRSTLALTASCAARALAWSCSSRWRQRLRIATGSTP
jgi:hypothetical protein